MTFGLFDLLDDVPDHLQDKFDVLHVRLLLGAGPAVDKSVFIDCFRKMLKPGGWLQWDELAWPPVRIVHPPMTDTNPGDSPKAEIEPHPALVTIAKHMALDERYGWFDRFEETFTKAGGFEAINDNVIPLRPHLMKMETELVVAVITDFVNVFMAAKKIEQGEPFVEMQEAVLKIQRDRDSGKLFAYNWHVGVARKK